MQLYAGQNITYVVMIKNEMQWILRQCIHDHSCAKQVGLFVWCASGGAVSEMSNCSKTLRPTHPSASQKPCQVLATNQLSSLAHLFGSAQHGAGLDFKGSLGKVEK